MRTYEEAKEIVSNLHDLTYKLLRKVAAERMIAADYEEIGSSDVSCEVLYMVQYDDYFGPTEDQMQADILKRLVKENPNVSYQSAVEMFAPVD